MSAIEAASVRVNTLADGTLRLTLDIEPRNALAAFTLFGAPGTPLALAALRTKPALKEPPKQQLMSQWVAMRCEEEAFQTWMCATDAKTAAEAVRQVLGIASRSLIDSDHEVRQRFDQLILKPWNQHNRQPA